MSVSKTEQLYIAWLLYLDNAVQSRAGSKIYNSMDLCDDLYAI